MALLLGTNQMALLSGMVPKYIGITLVNTCDLHHKFVVHALLDKRYERRLVKIETPQETELEVCLNIMDVPPEDQNSQHWINGLKRRILNFSTKKNEKFYECWERYMEAINAYPHHGFDTWLLVSYFYYGMHSSMKQLLETMCRGDFMNINMKAKVAAMARRLEELEMKKVQEVQAISETSVQAMPCSICQSYEHLVEECPTIPVKPKPPQYTQPAQAPQQASNLEQVIVNLSKGIHEVEAQEGESSKMREVKAVITLRSGKEVDQPTSKPKHDEEKPKRIVIKEDMMKKHMPPSFPQALHGKKRTNNASEIFEVLKQVKVNIPLLDMIKQVPTYAKFLKDLCTVKKRLNVNKKALLTEQVSAII
ncbi:hypothetical protein CK203_077791 [Vitis vinifera]|uniref:Retrotransposon gag domain-containing protein n=1 Tax=Vitis vinifera TaxID=29760 RepID=A0A438EWQ3_VITVI|nr:hypothetical protein CK203_077791 [Vitis vinifera]